MPCMLFAIVGCGDNNAAPDANGPPKFDGAPSDGDGDGSAPGVPVNITNLTPAANVVQRADFVTPLFFKPDGSAVAVVANYLSIDDAPTRDDPYVVPLDGSGFSRLSDAATCGNGAQCDAETLAWTVDGSALFAVGDLATSSELELFKLDPLIIDQTPVLAADAINQGDVSNVFTVASGGGATRVWALGDWMSNNRTQAGAFGSNDTLPFSGGTEPPIVVPNGAIDEVFDGGNLPFPNAFHARGDKIAYVSNESLVARFDLHIANADGSSSTVLVQGTVGIDITAVSISPDGTKVAYVQNGVGQGFDLRVVPAAGGASKLLSPARPSGAPAPTELSVFPDVEWSADSKFVAFSGDLTDEGFDEGFVVDTDAATPAAVTVLPRSEIGTQTSGTQGIRGKLLFDADNNIYFCARLTTDVDTFTLFKATTAGTKETFDLPARSDNSTPDVGAFGISPDGSTIVFSSDSPTKDAYNLFRQTL